MTMTRVLAIETSTELLGVAVVDQGGVVSEFSVKKARIHSKMLLPLCISAVETAGLDLESFDCIAVSAGPGSFTGLRIGCATAQGLALAFGKAVAMIPTFEIYLRQCSVYPSVAIVQGKAKSQTVCAFYQRPSAGKPSGAGEGEDGFHRLYGFQEIEPIGAKSYDEFFEVLDKAKISVWVTGDAAKEFTRVAQEAGRSDVKAVDEILMLPRPAVAGLIGLQMFEKGQVVEPSSAVPKYYRRSQAEVVFAKGKARVAHEEFS